MTQPKTTRIPAPLYAAAGAGDLAYRRLRQLPAVVTDLTDKAAGSTAELREKANATLRTANTAALDLRARAGELDVDRLRSTALRNAASVLAGAYAAQSRAVAAYTALVAHGEQVIGSGVVQAADTVNADIETTREPAEVTAPGAEPKAVKAAAESASKTKRTTRNTRTTKGARTATKKATGSPAKPTDE